MARLLARAVGVAVQSDHMQIADVGSMDDNRRKPHASAVTLGYAVIHRQLPRLGIDLTQSSLYMPPILQLDSNPPTYKRCRHSVLCHSGCLVNSRLFVSVLWLKKSKQASAREMADDAAQSGNCRA